MEKILELFLITNMIMTSILEVKFSLILVSKLLAKKMLTSELVGTMPLPIQSDLPERAHSLLLGTEQHFTVMYLVMTYKNTSLTITM